MSRFPSWLLITRHALFKRGIAALFFAAILFGAGSFLGLARDRNATQYPPLDLWVTEPGRTNASPKIIASANGTHLNHSTITLPQGSIVSAHLAGQAPDAPALIVNGKRKIFTADPHGGFSATEVLTQGTRLAVRRGWVTLASWNIRVMPDNPPHVSITAPPVLTDDKKLRLTYEASDDFGITEIALRVTPRDPSPGANHAVVDIHLLSPTSQRISRTDIQDIAAHPWAGNQVTLQIVATNEAGKKGLSDAVELTLPERSFLHPLALVLIEERAKLMQNPEDRILREETATIMANIAHNPATYHGDPLILMALRSGAVRLFLGHDLSTTISVNDLLWQAASRIEDGVTGTAQHAIQDARQDMANDDVFSERKDERS